MNQPDTYSVPVSWSGGSEWKRFASAIFISLAVIAVFNYFIDPYAVWGFGHTPALNLNQYQNKLHLFREYQPPPEVLIFGSSLIGGSINPATVTEITGLRAFNWGVPVAKPEIYYACVRMAVEEFNAPIKMVIVGVEPRVFDSAKLIHPQARSSYAYSRYWLKEPAHTIILEKASRLFTMEQTVASFRVALRMMNGDDIDWWITWGPDGFPSYDYEKRPATFIDDPVIRRLRGIQDQISNWTPGFNELGEDRREYWGEFLDFCEGHDIDVYCFMPPPHPDLLAELYKIGADAIYEKTREYLDETVTSMGGTFRDYTLLESVGGNPDWYNDEDHPNPENGDLILLDLLDDFKDNTAKDFE